MSGQPGVHNGKWQSGWLAELSLADLLALKTIGWQGTRDPVESSSEPSDWWLYEVATSEIEQRLKDYRKR